MQKKWITIPWVQQLLFCVLSVVIFFPNLSRTFASDDFEVIRRVGLDRRLLIPGFFRPLSDLTLLGNYLAGGWHAWGYYLFNILVHGVNSYLVMVFCLRWGWTVDRGQQRSYAVFAGLLFLVYPFHSEGIDWILGRGATLSTFFGLAALTTMLGGLPAFRRLFWAALLYFIGMAAYEPVILLPLFCLIILYTLPARRKEMFRWGIVLLGVLVLHVGIRIWANGGISGRYEGGFFRAGLPHLAGNAVKVAGRLFLPPAENSRAMVVLFLLLIAGWVAVAIYFIRRTGQTRERRIYLCALLLMLVIACCMPVITGVSTRTSESDRLLYFPSVFLCCILAFLPVTLVKGRFAQTGVVAGVLIYMLIFLEEGNRNWVRASDMTRAVLKVAGSEPKGKRLLIVNLPDELRGAYIFRNGFPEAMGLIGRNDKNTLIISHLTWDLWCKTPDSIRAEMTGDGIRIPPGVRISRMAGDSVLVEGSSGESGDTTWRAGGGDDLFYWNKGRLVRLSFL
jgi:protein O-mannosyl-transferase